MSKVDHEHPLAEVFGFPTDNFSSKAQRYRNNKLCPYHNKVPSCTKDKANAPLGVCSIYSDDEVAITCPVRFREDWLIAEDAANFFFPQATAWTSLAEVRIHDAHGKTAGNIDIVLVSYDRQGHVIDFGALEIQAVYISGNVRRPFEFYLSNPRERHAMNWRKRSRYYPRPDYLSSSRKRLAPQMLYKGSILNAWGKKMAVALHSEFYKTMPNLPTVGADQADLAWLIYDLQYDAAQNLYHLAHTRTIYTQFKAALEAMITPTPGPVQEFIEILQDKLDEHLDSNAPDVPTLVDVLEV